jgi:uncharacterized protein (DUF2062 family)
MNKIKAKFKHHFEEVVKTKSSPHEIGLGFAIGVLIAILPTPGISVLIGVLIVLTYKNVNKYSLFGALAIFNPFFMIPFYYLSFKIGNLIFDSEPILRFNIVFLNVVYNYTRRYLIGNFIVSIVTSIISYFVVKYSFIRYYKKNHKK